MKTITIGDIHGKDCWKQIDISLYDKVIFVGDYLDSFTILPTFQLVNLNDIIQLKKDNLDKVVLLFGNHDIHYLYYPKYKGSGFQEYLWQDYYDIFKKNESLFQIAYQIENYLWTHAGVSRNYLKWLEKQFLTFTKPSLHTSGIGDFLNRTNDSINREFLHTISLHRGGMDPFGGITWADKKETKKDLILGIHQIVGHSKTKDIETYGDETSSITYVDCLDTKIKFYEKEI